MANPDEAVLVTDRSWRVLYGNIAACRLLGCTVAELQSTQMRDTFPSAEAERSEEVLRQLQSGHELQFQRRLRRRDGTFVLADVHWEVLDDGRFRVMIRPVSNVPAPAEPPQ